MPTASARSTILCVILAPLALCGCRRDPADVLDDVDKSVRSWAATVEMTADEHSRARAPDTYVDQVIDAAREALDDQQKSLAKVPPSDPHRAALDGQIASLRKRLDALSGARQGGSRK